MWIVISRDVGYNRTTGYSRTIPGDLNENQSGTSFECVTNPTSKMGFNLNSLYYYLQFYEQCILFAASFVTKRQVSIRDTLKYLLSMIMHFIQKIGPTRSS